ncbi:MAG: hypothetical protein KC592_15965 [Nitrospira sp.]|nr:hypothetical protein [Nitrospira sp.]MCW5784805.1 hypothetical protein [Nitrospirales bacterium]
MITIDGARYSGSGSIVRQSVAFCALTGQDVHIVNAPAKRKKTGLWRYHVLVVEAMCEQNGRPEARLKDRKRCIFIPGAMRESRCILGILNRPDSSSC